MSKKPNASKWLKKDNASDDSSSGDEAPAKKPVAKAPATKKPVAKKPVDSSDSDSDEDVAPKKGSAKAPAKAPAAATKNPNKWLKGGKSDSDSDDEPTPAKKAPAKPAPAKGVPSKWAKKAASSDEDSEDDDEDSDESGSEDDKAPAKKSGGWFKATQASDSDSEESEEETDDDEEEEKPVKKAPAPKAPAAKANKWLKKEGSDSESSSDENDLSDSEEEEKSEKGDDSDDDESSDDGKRVVKSRKEKTLEEMKALMDKIQEMIKESEWKAITDELSNLFKIAEKLKKIPDVKETPKAYIRFISNFEDEVDKAQSVKKKMTPTNAKALGSIKGKIRKYNADFKQQIALYKKDPDAYIDEEDVAESDEEEEETEGDKGSEWVTKPTKGGKKHLQDTGKKISTTKTKAPKQKAPEQPKEIKWTDDLIEQKLNELKSDIGYRGTNPVEQMNELKNLLSHVRKDAKILQILIIMISSQFSMNSNMEYMPSENWKNCVSNAERALHIVENNPKLTIIEADETTEDSHKDDDKRDNVAKIAGSFGIIFERLDDEFTKSLQHIDPHTQDYVTRLRDEVILLDLGERVFSFYINRLKNSERAASVALRFMEHLHHRRQEDHVKMLKNQRTQSSNLLSEMLKTWVDKKEDESGTSEVTVLSTSQPSVIQEDLGAFMETLVDQVYKHSDLRNKTKALLLHMYNLSLQGKFYQARDMLLMSKLQDTISEYDVVTQVLFNRAVTQLGLCAFRNGLIAEAHDALVDICSSQRVILLAQSNVRYADKNKKVEVDRLEKQRRIPFHRHINIDMLEGVHLISAMLLEVPNMAQNTYNNVKKKVISKAFRRLLDFYDRQQVYAGPPENTRDYINVAARALSNGDWKKCYDTLLKMDDLWQSMIESDSIKSMLLSKIKTEALRTYILQFSRHYDTISIQSLANMFDLSTQTVHSIVSRMMINEELHAAWDQPTQSIQLFHAEPSKLQYLALQLAERATNFVEYNERLYDAKSQGGSLIAPSKEQKERSAAHRAQQTGQVQRTTTQQGDQKKTSSSTTQSNFRKGGSSSSSSTSTKPTQQPVTTAKRTTTK